MEFEAEIAKIWIILLDAGGVTALTSVAAKIIELNDKDLDMLACHLMSGKAARTALGEWIAFYVKHETFKRAEKRIEEKRMGNDHPYRLITEREARQAGGHSLVEQE